MYFPGSATTGGESDLHSVTSQPAAAGIFDRTEKRKSRPSVSWRGCCTACTDQYQDTKKDPHLLITSGESPQFRHLHEVLTMDSLITMACVLDRNHSNQGYWSQGAFQSRSTNQVYSIRDSTNGRPMKDTNVLLSKQRAGLMPIPPGSFVPR